MLPVARAPVLGGVDAVRARNEIRRARGLEYGVGRLYRHVSVQRDGDGVADSSRDPNALVEHKIGIEDAVSQLCHLDAVEGPP